MKELFTVPEGTKVTEKMFVKVLVSSICSILLCMSCLAGTTWAWFAVSIENTGNVIEIHTVDPDDVKVTVNKTDTLISRSILPAGNCTIDIENINPPDDLDKKATLYVTLIFDDVVAGYVTLNGDNQYTVSLEGNIDDETVLSWIVSWFPPDSTEPLNARSLLDEDDTEDATDAADPTEKPTETTEPADEESEESNTDESEPDVEDSSADSTDPPAAEPDPTEKADDPTETVSTDPPATTSVEPATIPPTDPNAEQNEN